MPVTARPARSTWKKIVLVLTAFGPGLFLVGYNIGTGSITTMASTGAAYGMMLAWPVLLSCIFTYVLIIAFGRYTAITGETALTTFKANFGKPVTLFVLGSLLFTEFVSSMGVMAVVTEAVNEWSRPLTSSGEGISTVILTLIFGTILYVLFWNGQYRFFEKVLTLFVGLMGLSFVLTMFMVIPDPAEVMAGMLPSVPREANAALLIAGMVGTTMGGVLYVIRSIIVKEKGWSVGDLKQERRDAFVSSLVMFLLSIAIMACAAGTLYPLGLRVENAIDMVRLLEPLAGRFAISIFIVGIVSAGLSSLFPIYLLGPWLIADYQGKKQDLRSPGSRLFVLFVASLGLIVPIFGGRPVIIMIMSQALMTLVTPVVITLMFILQNRKPLAEKHPVPLWLNVVMVISLIFSILMAVTGIVGLLGGDL